MNELACKLAADTSRSWSEFLQLAVPPLTILAVIGLVAGVTFKLAKITVPKGSGALVAAFCLVGTVPGIVAGYSQQAVAGTFLTATVGIVSALLSFAFAKDSLEAWRPVIPLAMIVVLVGAIAGFASGGVTKHKWLMFDQSRERAKFEHENLWVPVEKERRLNNLKILAKQSGGLVTAAELTRANMAPIQPVPEECEQ